MKSNIIASVTGTKGSGKTYLVREQIIPILLKDKIYGDIIILDPIKDNFNEGLVFPSVRDYLSFVKEGRENDSRLFTIKIDNIADYELALSYFRQAQKNCVLILEELSIVDNPRSENPDLSHIARIGRHWGTSVIGITQRPANVGTTFRSQVDFPIIFSIKKTRDIEEYRGFTDQYKKIQQLSKKEHEFTILGRDMMPTDFTKLTNLKTFKTLSEL